MLVFQDWALFLSHVVLVLFNMFGWIWKSTRVLHLITMGLTSFSWFALGAIYGWGYCFCTDYHAEVLRQLGSPDANITFIQLMFKRLLGLSVSQERADWIAFFVFALILLAMAIVWTRTWLEHRKRREGHLHA